MKSLLFVVNVDWFFISHRLPIALKAKQLGYNVHIATTLTGHKKKLEDHGLIVHELNISRGSSNIFSALSILLKLILLFKQLKPDLVHCVTIKPVIIGGIACHFTNLKGVVFSISGLGYVFIKEGIVNSIRKRIVSFFYKISLNHKNMKVIFQNNSDKEIISQIAGLNDEEAVLIKGSGVDLKYFSFSDSFSETPLVLLASRMLKDKGIHEFVEAAAIVKKESGNIKFVLVGSPDPENNASITLKEILQWEESGIIEYWGQRDDMMEIISQSSIVVLPSYREGMPKILLEAAAVGRPVITTDVPGCRDAIIPNKTGLLVPMKDPLTLAEKIKFLLSNEASMVKMGREGRKFAERNFNISSVVKDHMNIYSSFFYEEIS